MLNSTKNGLMLASTLPVRRALGADAGGSVCVSESAKDPTLIKKCNSSIETCVMEKDRSQTTGLQQ